MSAASVVVLLGRLGMPAFGMLFSGNFPMLSGACLYLFVALKYGLRLERANDFKLRMLMKHFVRQC